MGGPGHNSREGSRLRLVDAQTVTGWVFDSFATRAADSIAPRPISVLGGAENAVCLIPAFNRPLTVPAVLADSTPKENAAAVEAVMMLPSYLSAPVARGDAAGKIVYALDGIVLQEIPLVADRTVEQGFVVKRALDALAPYIIPK
jgi:D-alanyl-D-alanine carboxypeptidase